MFAALKPPVFPIRVSVVSGRLATREITETINRKLRLLRLSDDVLSTCELVLSEVLNNVVEHAYPEGDPPGPITVECIDLTDGLKFTVIDQGVGMPGGQKPEGKAQNLNVEMQHLPEGGFGWNLIEMLARNVAYQRSGWENRLSFELPIDASDG